MNSEAVKKLGGALPTSDGELGSRLLAVVDRIGTRQKASEISGRSTDQIAKYIKGAAEPPFIPLGKLCAAAGVSMEWLATGKDLPQPAETNNSQTVRQDDVTLAVQLLREELDNKHLWLPPAKHAEAVLILAQLLASGLPDAEVRQITRKTAVFLTDTGTEGRAGAAAKGIGGAA